MTEDDKYALKEFLQAASVLVGIPFTILIILVVIIKLTSTKPIDESLFEVVDRYKECDVVRYAPHQVAEYKYFLYCEKNK